MRPQRQGFSAVAGDLAINSSTELDSDVKTLTKLADIVKTLISHHGAHASLKDVHSALSAYTQHKSSQHLHVDSCTDQKFLDEITRQLTPEKEAETYYRKAFEHANQYEHELEAIGTLAGGIAHDFNNLLTALFANISLAKLRLSDEHAALHALEGAETVMDRAKLLSGKLLTFSHGGEPVKTRLDLELLIRSVISIDLESYKTSSTLERSGTLWQAQVDEMQTRLIFSNLITNARQAMDNEGHISISLENFLVESRQAEDLAPGRYIKIQIRDHGPGMEAPVLERIFNPYFTTSETGRGMGLAICRSIVKRHYGMLTAESQAGMGALFSIYLPATEPSTLQQTAPSEHSTLLANPIRVLVVDDEPMICEVAKGLLETQGHDIEIANNGNEAVTLYKKSHAAGNNFDIVILDLSMPGMSGQETVKHLLHFDQFATCIVSSGYANDPIVAHFSQYGFKARLPKPYDKQELLAALKQAMNTREMETNS